MSARVAFDPSSPFIVATSEMHCGDRRFVRGDPFPWRELGVSDLDLAQLWVALKIDCVDRAVVETPSVVTAKQPKARPQPRR